MTALEMNRICPRCLFELMKLRKKELRSEDLCQHCFQCLRPLKISFQFSTSKAYLLLKSVFLMLCLYTVACATTTNVFFFNTNYISL